LNHFGFSAKIRYVSISMCRDGKSGRRMPTDRWDGKPAVSAIN
jgi:hypothetical protein